jgi:hypothetical protein
MSVNPETLTETVSKLGKIRDAAKAVAADIAKERAAAENPMPTAPLMPIQQEGEK